MSVIDIPVDYSYCLIVVSLTAFHHFVTGQGVRYLRNKYFYPEWLKENFGNELNDDKQDIGQMLAFGYPDQGKLMSNKDFRLRQNYG